MKPVRNAKTLIKGPPEELFRGTKPSLWKFWQHGVTSSLLNSFLTCREQTRLAYVEGLASLRMPLAIEFGLCCHWVLEQAYTKMLDLQSLKTDFIATSWVKTAVKAYEKKWNKESIGATTAQLQQQELVYGLAEAVLPAYFKMWDGDFKGGKYSIKHSITPVAKWESLEKVFKVTYRFKDGKTVPITGRRDAVFRNKLGKLWVFDTKCRSMINHEDALDTLPFDLQQMLYVWVTWMEYDEVPEGIVMNIIRRPGHRKGEDALPVFIKRVAADVQNPKKYYHNFTRYQMTLSKDEIVNWKENTLDPIMEDVRGWWEGWSPHYMNHNSLITKYGHCGLYLPICKNDTSQTYKREKVFAEL